MRCYYEVLGVEPRASDEEIRSAYKKKSLMYHPDRNYGNQEEAAIKFKEVHNAYTILSDTYERSWYDAHRNQILNDYDVMEETSNEHEINLFKYFTDTCFDNFDDSETGFYRVYSNVFEMLKEEESRFSKRVEIMPIFGTSETPWEEVNEFYIKWKNFNSMRNFAWKDEYKVNEMEDRYSRRAAERVNQKKRNAAKKEFDQTVLSLVNFVHRRDPRVKAAKELQEAEENKKAAEMERNERERIRRRREAKQRAWEEAAAKELREEKEHEQEGDLRDGSTFDLLYDNEKHVEMIKKLKTGEYGNMKGFAMLVDDDDLHNDEQNKDVNTNCSICKKRFTSVKLYEEHANSAKHKKKVKQLSQQQSSDNVDPNMDLKKCCADPENHITESF